MQPVSPILTYTFLKFKLNTTIQAFAVTKPQLTELIDLSQKAPLASIKSS